MQRIMLPGGERKNGKRDLGDKWGVAGRVITTTLGNPGAAEEIS